VHAESRTGSKIVVDTVIARRIDTECDKHVVDMTIYVVII
jgi:hypothetical protein